MRRLAHGNVKYSDFEPEWDWGTLANMVNISYLTHQQRKLLTHRSRLVKRAFSSLGAKTLIPTKVSGKFSLRLVPNQDPLSIEQQVTDLLNKAFADLASPNKLQITMIHGARAWLSNPKNPRVILKLLCEPLKRSMGNCQTIPVKGGVCP
jgi:acetylornithine deacetylase/succinyl-diaminopimelate desuccinylase-like protein